MEKIGKYQIVGELGTGGFGTVYKATDPSMGRDVAIKVLKAQDDAGMVKRFQAEARTAANLRHRNIVTVFEFGEENGMQFLVMEYLDGTTLRDLIVDKAPLSPVEKLNIMSEAALGLKAAHESGILHRDVKPANIMRLSDGSVKIMDFGISRPMGDVDTRLTQAGFLMGTPQYMAPEQFISDSDADVLCDIWAYGVVLYEFLTGVNPFHAGKPAQIIYRLTTEEPRPLAEYLPEIPERLEGVVKRLLSKNRDRRYQSIEDARFDLQPVLLEMREAQVLGLIATTEDLIRERRLDEAQAMVRRVLDLDQSNAWARKWRGELKEMLRAQSIQVRVQQLLGKADLEAAAGDQAAAAEHLKEALKLDPSNDGARRRIDEIQANRARAERAASLLASAREEMNRKALTRALEHASQAAETDPTSAEAKQLVSQINQAMEQRGLEALRKNALNSATRLVLLQAYDEAISVLKQFSAQAPGDTVIKDRLEEVKRLYAAHLEQQRIERAIGESKELLRRGKYQQAIDVLTPCAQSSPQNTEIRQLLAYAAEQAEVETRAAQVREILETGEGLARGGEIEKALDLAGQALELAPDNEQAQQLRDRMLEARRRRDEDLEVSRLAARCRAGLASGALDDAAVLATELANRFPGNPVAKEVKQEVEGKLKARRDAHEREMREQRQRVEALLSAGKSDEATIMLQSLSARFPAQKQAFAPLYDRAAKVERENREREMRQEAARAEQLLTAGMGEEATLILQSLTARFPGQKQEFAPLFDRAAAVEREKRERQAIEREVAEIRKFSEAGRWEEALRAIEQALEKRPDQPEFVEERDRVRRGMAAARDKREREAVQAELMLIRRVSAAGRWEEALAALERSLVQRPDQPEFLEERDAVRRGMAAAREKRERQAIDAAVGQIRQMIAAGRWEDALAEIERGLTERPNQPEFLEERDVARQGMAAARGHREQQAVSAGVAEIRELSAEGRWQDALAKADELLKLRPNEPEFLEERDAARKGLAAARGKKEQQEIKAAVARVRESCSVGKWDEALTTIDELLKLRPHEPEFLEERDAARKGLAAARGQKEQEEIKAAVAQVRGLVSAGKWGEALKTIDELLAQRPNEPEFLEERDAARKGMAAARGQREQQQIRAAVAQVRELSAAGKWDEALRTIDKLLDQRPNEPEFLEERDAARKGMAAARGQREQQEIKAAVALVREMSTVGRWEVALTKVEELLAARPDQPEFLEERDFARKGQAAARGQREQQEIRAALGEVRKLSAADQWEEALAKVEELLEQRPNEPEFLKERDAARKGMAAARGQREQQEIKAAVALVREMSTAGRWEEAVAKVEELLATRPNQPEFLEERDFARKGQAAARGQREQQEIKAALGEVGKLSAAGQWEEALARIDALLAKRPNQPEFLEERDQARKGMAAARGQREQQEIQAAAAQAHALGAAGKWEEALAEVERLLAKRPNQPEFLEERDQLRRGLAGAREQRERQAIENELANFRRLTGEGRWEEALAEIELALARRQNQPQFVEERERVRRRMAGVQALREIELTLSRGEFNPAIAMAESALRQYPEEQRIGTLLGAAKEQRKLAEDVGRAEGLLRKNEIDPASALIVDLVKRHPDDAGVQRLRQTLERLTRRRKTFGAVEQARKRLEFQRAIELAGQLVKEDADDAAAHDLLEALGREQAEHARAQRIASGRSEAMKLLGARKFDAAQQALAKLAKEYPEHADIQDDLRRVQEARQEHEKKDAYARGRAEADALVKQRKLDEGIARLQALLTTYPDDPFLLQDLKAAEETKALRDRAATVEAEIRALEALFNRGDAQGVKDRASKLLEKYEEPRARELLNWATKTLTEVRGIRRKIDGTMQRALWIGGAAVLILLAVVVYLKTRPVPATIAELSVRPPELSFAYQRGGAAPKALTLEVKGTPADKVWTAAASDAWFTVRPEELKGSGTIQVTVDPSRLAPGAYSGFATIAAKDSSVSPAAVRIRMQVTAPEEPAPKPAVPEKTGKKTVETPVKNPKVVPEVKTPVGPVTTPPNPAGAGNPAGQNPGQVVTSVPPPDPTVDCKAGDYGYLFNGDISWAGSLGPGEAVTITRRNTVSSGPAGRVRGSHLPGCDVTATVVSGGVQIAEPPLAANRFGHVVVKNNSAQPVTSFTIHWAVK